MYHTSCTSRPWLGWLACWMRTARWCSSSFAASRYVRAGVANRCLWADGDALPGAAPRCRPFVFCGVDGGLLSALIRELVLFFACCSCRSMLCTSSMRAFRSSIHSPCLSCKICCIFSFVTWPSTFISSTLFRRSFTSLSTCSFCFPSSDTLPTSVDSMWEVLCSKNCQPISCRAAPRACSRYISIALFRFSCHSPSPRMAFTE
mmetsp:Transcript_12644/g.31071  ORF Transcript_12644/g.31071 Transcript_12644/m.31071 type:complete len:204 (+) Transcript_12644:929-1540(+)